jgi:FkbM family methyltransferase
MGVNRIGMLAEVRPVLTTPTERDLTLLKSSSGSDARAQNFQDVFVIWILGKMRGGYFAEVGAANGVQFSNTHLLEKQFGWTGLLVEPAVCWHPHILKNRRAKLDTRCAWSTSGDEISFCQLPDSNLSTASKYLPEQLRTWRTSPTCRYDVKTATLQEILRDAPPVVDYLSLDVEGAELEVLAAYDFSHNFRVVTVEHNFQEQRRSQIRSLLSSRGYLRVCEDLSKFDDWYVRRSELVRGDLT